MKSEKLQLIFLRIALLRHLRVCSPMHHCGEGFRIFNRIKLEKVVNFIIVSKAQNDESFMQLFCKCLFHLNSYVFQKKKLLTFQLMVNILCLHLSSRNLFLMVCAEALNHCLN